tara:strand:+ start:48 stop:323 length:276 start_codon:yes stop_codon:yes gene_type:complete
MTEKSIGPAGASTVAQTKEDIARKIADRHPEVSKKKLMLLSLAALRRILLSGKIEKKSPLLGGKLAEKNKSAKITTRRGGGIAKRGFGIAK